MSEYAKTPAIRFAGFTDAWEQRKLGDLVTFSKGNGYSKADIKGSGTPIILYGRLYTRYETVISDVDTLAEPKAGSVYSKGGEVIVPASGETAEDISIASVVKNSDVMLGGDLNVMMPCSELDSVFLALAVSNGKIHSELSKRAQGKSVVHLHNEDLESVDINFPTLKEQQLIGSIVVKIENLITLHQRKYDRLLNIKKSMLDKMFPKDGATVPEIRFAGFIDAWEQREFANTFDVLTNNTLPRAELSVESGAARNVHYGDVLIKFGECLEDVSELPYIEDTATVKKLESSLLQSGDVIIADTAEDETVGKCTEILDICGQKVLSGLHTIPCRPKEKFAKSYLGYFMNSPTYHEQLRPLMQGIKVTSVSKSALQNTMVAFPASEKEQSKIGAFFFDINHLITLHQRELERLQNIKKSCLEKMFV